MTKRAVAVIGSVTIDRIVRGGESFCQIGGVSTYAGITFQRLGIRTFIVSNVADRNGSIFKALREEGIHILRGHSENTTRFINHIDGDDRWQEMPAAADPVTKEQVKRVLIRATHLHVGALHPTDLDPGVLQSIRKADRLLVSLDVQGYVRSVKNNRVEEQVSENLTDALLCTSIVKADEKELAAILDSFRMTLPELLRAYRIDEIVVTAGPRGGFIRTSTGEEFHYDARPVDSRDHAVVGAGDVFFAAYLTDRLYEGKTIPVSSRRAANLVARQVEGRFITRRTLRLEI